MEIITNMAYSSYENGKVLQQWGIFITKVFLIAIIGIFYYRFSNTKDGSAPGLNTEITLQSYRNHISYVRLLYLIRELSCTYDLYLVRTTYIYRAAAAGRVQDFSRGGGVNDVGTIAGYSPLYWSGGSRSLHLIKNGGEKGGPLPPPPPDTRLDCWLGVG